MQLIRNILVTLSLFLSFGMEAKTSTTPERYLLSRSTIRHGLREKTTYVVKNNINLRNADLIIPEGCIIDFAGGRILNGRIHFCNTYLSGDICFQKVSPSGVIINQNVSSSWFSNSVDCLDWLCSLPSKNVDFCNHEYEIESSLKLSKGSSYRNLNVRVVGKGCPSVIVFNGTEKSYPQKLDAANISLTNVSIDANKKSANGIAFYYSDTITIESCHIMNSMSRDDSQVVNGIYLFHCDNIYINSCNIEGIISDKTDLYPRGITMVTCHRSVIENSDISKIGDNKECHGDGIQIAVEDSHALTDVGNNSILKTTISDCRYRLLKLQQRGIVVDSCSLITRDKAIQQEQSAISVYNSDMVIRNSYILSLASIPINLGVSNSALSHISNIRIINNRIENNSSSYIGSIHTSNSSRNCMLSDITVEDNYLIDKSIDHRNVGVSIRNVAMRYSIVGNTFEGFDCVLEVRDKYMPDDGFVDSVTMNKNILRSNKNVFRKLVDNKKRMDITISDNKNE